MNPILDIRQSLGWSQGRLGLAIGVPESRISKLEHGSGVLRGREAEALAKLSGVQAPALGNPFFVPD